MTRFLISDENPTGLRLEDILTVIRADIMKRCLKIAHDERPEARHVLANNMRVLNHITDAILLAEDSSKVLDKAFGKSHAMAGGPPRIGDV